MKRETVRRITQYCANTSAKVYRSEFVSSYFRLQTIIDNDKILVLSDGRALEFASPYELLCNEQSHFSQLASQAGQYEAENLMKQAQRAANTRHS